ncbi:MAG: OmpA family protein [Planctomycetota bacterium]
MSIRKSLLLLSLVVSSLATGCTTRYQDMLRERDERIRELSGEVATLRGENADLQARPTAPAPANAAAARPESPSMINELQNAVGDDASVRYVRGRVSIGVEDSVTFDSGSTALKDSSHKVLRNVASLLKGKFAGKRFYVEGHTDSDPIDKTKDKYRSNRHLSCERADAVARWLIQQGVSESAIVVVGFGQHDPRDSKQKARNRRVEIVVGESM